MQGRVFPQVQLWIRLYAKIPEEDDYIMTLYSCDLNYLALINGILEEII